MTDSSELIDLVQTSFVVHPDVSINDTTTLVYCPTFQLAWSILAVDIIGAPLLLEGNPPMAQALNTRAAQPVPLSPDSYLALAGRGADNIIERISSELQRRFNRKPGIELLPVGLNDILAYAYLRRTLSFAAAFMRYPEPLVFADGCAVQAFGMEGVSSVAVMEQVTVASYFSDEDFVLQIASAGNDELLLAKVPPAATLQATIDAVLARVAAGSASGQPDRIQVDSGERLAIPCLHLHAVQRFDELIGKQVLNKGYTELHIGEAIQMIGFELNEYGAQVESEVVIHAIIGYGRAFVFDRPFLLCMREHGYQQPYLAAWVANSEIMRNA